VIASSAVLTSNRLTAGEEKVRAKSDYDPAAVNPDDKQSTASKFLLGVDIKRIPPYRDDAMQARIDKIGESLVPEYQKRLSDSDPAKVRFRFQLVDVPGWRDTAISPGGVILVPKQVVERMQNDSQLAAVLADGVAAHLEKGAFRMLSLNHKAEAAELASLAIAGGVGIGVTAKVYSDALRRIQDQAARVSLWLMNDAGYTITEAPKAWWLLSSKETKPLVEVKLPEHVGYLYEALGTTRRDEIANAKKDPASP
jgi:predicted Zn-dependent protease